VSLTSKNPTAKANTSARRRNRVTAAKEGHREVTLEEVWRRDHGRCCICGLPVALELAHLEHQKALKNGGEHVRRNLGASHALCNLKKGSKTAAQIRKAKARPGLKRKSFRRKVKPPTPEQIAVRDSRLYDQTPHYPEAPIEGGDPSIPDDTF